MANEETPEERLKKYKERLAKMTESEGRDSKLSNQLGEEKAIVERGPPSQPQPVPKDAPIGPKPQPPPVLESPAKRELRESMVVKKNREALVKKLEGKSRSRVMLQARQQAITSQLKEIKSRKSMLELQLKRKVISKDEFNKRRELLVKEGQELIREKSEIDEALAK
ncbi:hypothetical protein EU528_05880 [Candidatus Thorarchaeota archaeon]|nr:MAG: hypothetical protein EU528_05880 [Candidatus Thorarchaeota archaeon]